MDILQAEHVKLIRGVILRMVYDSHRKQQSHPGLLTLAGALERLFYDVSLNDLLTILQDLKERGYLEFVQTKDRWTGHVGISRIGITPRGRDLVEGTSAPDPAVQMP